jgi:hypothetical protein
VRERHSPMWRQAVTARADRLGQELHALTHTTRVHEDPDFASAEVLGRLHHAGWLADGPSRVRDRWSGAHIESCWRELHLAEEAMVHLSDSAHLPILAQRALTHAQAYLPAGDKRVKHLESALRQVPRKSDDLRAAIVPVLAAGHEASDRSHQYLRSYQNMLRTLTLVLLGMAIVAVVGALGWAASGDLLTAPQGLDGGWPIVVAFAAGAVGALFSAIPSLAQIPESTTPFNPVREQAGLKVVVGAWSGLVGMLVVTSGLGEAAVQPASSVAGFLIVAALFGANQEALTRFADHKASALRRASES